MNRGELEAAPWDLNDFLGELRSLGFDLGVDQRLTVQRLLLILAARGELPGHPRSLGGLLAPIICRSPEEQRSFHHLYREWLDELPGRSDTDGDVSKKEAEDKPRRRQRVTRRFTFRPSPGFYWLAGLVALVLIAGGAYLVTKLIGNDQKQDVQTPVFLTGTVFGKEGAPQPNAVVKAVEHDNTLSVRFFNLNPPLRESSATTGADGTYTLPLTGLRFPVTVTAAFENCSASAAFDDASKVTPIAFLLKCFDLNNEGLWQTVRRAANLLWLLAYKWRPYLLLAAFVLLLLLVARRRLYLKRWRTADKLHATEYYLERARAQLRQTLSLRRAVQNLRRQRQGGPKDLDVARTVEATVKARCLTPVYGSRKSAQEYLILINRTSPQDHLSRMEDEVVRHLVKNGIYVDRYYFNKDPRLCWQARQRARAYTLDELAASHPEHHLVIFDDGSAFFDPLTGGPRDWLSQFYNWPARAILTADFRANRYREEKLSDLGFLVLPATGDGIAALGGGLGRRARQEPPAGDAAAAPPTLLRTRAERWLEDYAPEHEVLEEMRAQLKLYIGDEGYYWLGACAVYPTLDWDLTLSLGYDLLDDSKVNEVLPLLLRLPWFQHGNMPDWVREALLTDKDLTPEREAKVRRTLDSLLRGGGRSPKQNGYSLTVARKIRMAAEFWRRRPFRRDGERPGQADSLIKDHVFMSFMLGIRRGRLSFLVPRELQTILIPGLGLGIATLISRFPLLVLIAGTLLVELFTAYSGGDLIMGVVSVVWANACLIYLYVRGELDMAEVEREGATAGQSVRSTRRRYGGLREAVKRYLISGETPRATESSAKSKHKQASGTRATVSSWNALFEYVSLFWYVEESWPKWFKLPFIAASIFMFMGAAVFVLVIIFVPIIAVL
jgi:hypothetical protein